jgi:RimJ/RimL family protein N-acetyltransferase
MFYELHPQLWNQGIMSEAFAEVMRYAFEVVGCTEVTVRHAFPLLRSARA